MLFVEAVALRADGDCKDRRQEQGSSRTIDGEHERVQGQGLASQCQDDGDNDRRPAPNDDRQAEEHH